MNLQQSPRILIRNWWYFYKEKTEKKSKNSHLHKISHKKSSQSVYFTSESLSNRAMSLLSSFTSSAAVQLELYTKKTQKNQIQKIISINWRWNVFEKIFEKFEKFKKILILIFFLIFLIFFKKWEIEKKIEKNWKKENVICKKI